MATFNDVWKIGMGLPEVEETTFYGTAGLKVKGKAFCRIWSEREYERDEITDTEVLVIFCELDEKETLIEQYDGVLFSTPHYDGSDNLLVRLTDATAEQLTDFLDISYLIKAPPSLIKIQSPSANASVPLLVPPSIKFNSVVVTVAPSSISNCA